MAYSIRFTTKRSGSGSLMSLSKEEIIKKAKSQFRQKLPATIYKDGEIIGRVLEDDSQRTGWNWFMEV